MFGDVVRTDQLESRVFDDINETLTLFNFTIPSFLRSFYSFALQVSDIYSHLSKDETPETRLLFCALFHHEHLMNQIIPDQLPSSPCLNSRASHAHLGLIAPCASH
jgi:hypothetical protein